MKIVDYHADKKAQILSEALVVLLGGGTVVYPTETAYGLGADFYSPHAYNNVYAIKKRGELKPLPVIVPDLHYARTLVEFTPRSSELATKYWPGPLTLVLPFLYKAQWPHHQDAYLALRVSSHPFASQLVRAFGRPLISTSANVSGHGPGYRIEDIVEQMERRNTQPDMIINAGDLPTTPPSTIVKDSGDELVVLRQGLVKI